MIPELRDIDFEIMKAVSKKEKTLSQIKDKIDFTYPEKRGILLSGFQKILKKLENVGYVKSERRGRKRFVVLTFDGNYFLKFYLKKKRKK